MDQKNKQNEEVFLTDGFKNSITDDIKLDEYSISRSYYPDTPKSVQWIIKHSKGFIKNEKEANYVLVGIIILSVIIILFLFFNKEGNMERKAEYNPDTKYKGEILPDNFR
jgi:hypothetical protein